MKIGPQPGPQQAFLSSHADIAIFGGAAGGGKTWALLLEPLRHVTTNKKFSAMFLRRTTTQITNPGGLWDAAGRLYPALGAVPRVGSLEWIWPKGGKIKMAHLEHEHSKNNYQGSEIPLLCCQEDELIRLGDGGYRRVGDLKVGDVVLTLQGPRPIIFVGLRRLEQCVRATVRDESGRAVAVQTHSLTHRLLTKSGWVSYADRCDEPPPFWISGPTEFHSSDRSSSRSYKLRQLVRRFGGILRRCRQRAFGSDRWFPGHLSSSEPSSCRARQAQGSDSGSFECEPQEPPQPSSVFLADVVLHTRTLLKAAPISSCRVSEDDEVSYVPIGSSGRDYPDDCSSSPHPHDEPVRLLSDSDPAFARRPTCVGEQNPKDWPLDDLGKAQTDIRPKLRYVHPYRNEERTAEEDTILGSCVMEPCGQRWVIDLTVNGESHYISSSGLVNKNCFDELPHFSESQFFYMVSRNRSTSGVRGYVRATCNPDADSWVASFISWWIDQTSGFPIAERAGVLRWMLRVNDSIDWADSRDELIERWRGRLPNEALQPKSVTFIPAKLTDNKALMQADPGYYANLLSLPTVERERLLGGNWKIRPSAGLYFQRRWLKPIDTAPDGTMWVRGWDLAGTPKTDTNNPDFTESVLMGRTFDGRYIIADHTYMRGTPAEVEQEILRLARQDRREERHVTISLPQDPAQAGKAQAAAYVKLLAGFDIRTSPESRAAQSTATAPAAKAAKIGRFGPFSAQCEAGNVYYLRGSWNGDFFDRLEAFPEAAKDDTADATSRAFALLGSEMYDGSLAWVGALETA